MIRELESHEMKVLLDDPVRPNIKDRSGKNRHVLVLDESGIKAVICIAITYHVPKEESELFWPKPNEYLNRVAVFYSVWSYEKGCGRKVAMEALDWIRDKYPYVDRVVTLSSKTEMAEKFHTRNGATKLQENEQTVNFEYQIERISDYA